MTKIAFVIIETVLYLMIGKSCYLICVLETLVKQLKIKIKDKIDINRKIFSSFKTENTQFLR